MRFLSRTPDNPATRTPSDTRMLAAIKGVLALLLIGFLLVGDDDRTWPLVTWPMFQKSGTSAPKTVSSLHIRAIAADGQVYEFPTGALSGILPGAALDKIVETTFDDDLDTPEQHDAQVRLAAMVRSALPSVNIVEIQAWDLTWKVHVDQTPMINVSSADEQNLLGKFRLADIETVS